MRAAPTLLCLLVAGAAGAAGHQYELSTSTPTPTPTPTSTPTPTPTPTPTSTSISTPNSTPAPTSAIAGNKQAPQEAVRGPRSRASRAAPWIAAGAGALAIGGAALWWDGARVSDELDARFAAGDLSAADGPRYARARRESIAGRVLVAGAAVLATTAVALWW